MRALGSLTMTYGTVVGCIGVWLEPLALLCLRFTGAKVFWDSGMTKWNGFLQFNTGKYDLFLYEFFCPDPARPGALQLCDSTTLEYTPVMESIVKAFAVAAGVMEVALSALLILGLLSRVSALGLLGMTMVIQFTVFPTWGHWLNPHMWWAVVLFAVVASGPGALSFDRMLGLEGKSRT